MTNFLQVKTGVKVTYYIDTIVMTNITIHNINPVIVLDLRGFYDDDHHRK